MWRLDEAEKALNGSTEEGRETRRESGREKETRGNKSKQEETEAGRMGWEERDEHSWELKCKGGGCRDTKLGSITHVVENPLYGTAVPLDKTPDGYRGP